MFVHCFHKTSSLSLYLFISQLPIFRIASAPSGEPYLQLIPAAVYPTSAWQRSLGMRAPVMSCVARTEGILQAFFGGDSRPPEIVWYS